MGLLFLCVGGMMVFMSYDFLFVDPKFAVNVGSLARSGELLGVDRLFVAGEPRNSARVAATDTAKSFNRIGVYVDDALEFVLASKAAGIPVFAVELPVGGVSSVMLPDMVHPVNCLYVVGSEDRGVPESILGVVDGVIEVPHVKPWSFNVAEAGCMVMYDRFAKLVCGKQ